jgi:hypothetical protein
MLPQTAVLAIVAAGLPAALVRLWWIWWQGSCDDCGLERRVCTCPPERSMRPRR